MVTILKMFVFFITPSNQRFDTPPEEGNVGPSVGAFENSRFS
jgi:hypothetical protein